MTQKGLLRNGFCIVRESHVPPRQEINSRHRTLSGALRPYLDYMTLFYARPGCPVAVYPYMVYELAEGQIKRRIPTPYIGLFPVDPQRPLISKKERLMGLSFSGLAKDEQATALDCAYADGFSLAERTLPLPVLSVKEAYQEYIGYYRISGAEVGLDDPRVIAFCQGFNK